MYLFSQRYFLQHDWLTIVFLRITIPEIRLHPWFQHKLPPYLRHPPELMEKQERVVDHQIIDEVMRQPFRRPIPRQTVEMASSLEATQLVGEIPKVIKDIRVVYELLLDHKHTRLRIMEVAQAIREAASASAAISRPFLILCGMVDPQNTGRITKEELLKKASFLSKIILNPFAPS